MDSSLIKSISIEPGGTMSTFTIDPTGIFAEYQGPFAPETLANSG